jgi:hypothetical protein
MAAREKDLEPGALASSPGEVDCPVMESTSDDSALPVRGGEPENQGSYEPPTIRDLGSLRDLVASGGSTTPDSHDNGVEGS